MKKLIFGTIIGFFVAALVLTVIFNEKAKKDETVTITYKLGEDIVHTQRVNRGSKVRSIYTYESDNHQSYASIWQDENGVEFTADTKVDKDITLYSEPLASLKLFTTPENEYTYINGINHVHKDGVVIVLDTYFDKELKLGSGAINNNKDIKELYLPNTIHQIFDGNFVDCDNLSTIYFSGSEEEWNSIPSSSVVPETIGTDFILLEGQELLNMRDSWRHKFDHMQKFIKADAIIVCNPDGIIGKGTMFEFGFMVAHGKRIIFTNEPKGLTIHFPYEIGVNL